MQVWAVKLDESFPRPQLQPASLPPHEVLAPLLLLLDAASAAHVNKFRRLEDAQRCLIGRLLPRHLLATRYKLPWSSLVFGKAASERPFAIHPDLPPHLDYNVSHDSNWVVMGWTQGTETNRVGVDVMRVKIPWEGETVDQFVEGLQDQLTTWERSWLDSSSSLFVKLRRVFSLWTLKEAYTKALGEGLGFDFGRLEFRIQGEPPRIQCFVEGRTLVRWEFKLVELDEEHLLAVATEGEGRDAEASLVAAGTLPAWIKVVPMAEMVSDRTANELKCTGVA